MTILVAMKITAFCNKGGRKYMEDLFSVAYQQTADLENLEFAFFGIFDGHGGVDAASYAKEFLMKNIISQKSFYSDDDDEVLKAIREGYLMTHQGMWKNLDKWPKTSSGLPSTAGTTASVAFIRHGKIYLGHVGDSGIVLGIEEEGGKKWNARNLTQDHKPESSIEKSRIMNSGGKVVVKSGVPRVVWNRPKIGHKGPIRRSTPIDEIPFLAVARSLGDLWSYNSALDEFVVSPDPDVSVVKIDNNFKCLIFGTDGLWNVVTSEEAVELVQKVDFSNDSMMNGSSQEWLNPSRCLVEHALNNWNKTKMRADNTSCVTVMLDPSNKKNLIKINNKTISMPGSLENNNVTNQNMAEQDAAATDATFEDRNMTMFDYSTREAFNLDQISSAPSAISLENNRVSADSYMFDGSYNSNVYQTNGEYYGNSLLHSSLSQNLYSHSPSTRQDNIHMNEYNHNYSLTKLQSRSERESQQQIYCPKRYMGNYHFGPGPSHSYHHQYVQQQTEMNMLPSIHNFVNDHHKYSMERFDYVHNFGHFHHNFHQEMVPAIEKHKVSNEETEAECFKMPLDDSIQINEVSSSYSDDSTASGASQDLAAQANSKDKDDAEMKVKSVRKRVQSTIKKRIFYETRLTKTRPRSCNSMYSQKNVASPSFSLRRAIKKKIATKVAEKQPTVVASLQNKLENALQTTIGKLKKKKKIVAKNKENDNNESQQSPVRSLRTSIRICANVVTPGIISSNSPILKQTQTIQATGSKKPIKQNSFAKSPIQHKASSSLLKRKTTLENNIVSTRNSKLRKLK